MSKEEFNLSEKIYTKKEAIGNDLFMGKLILDTEDVKEFIKRLKIWVKENSSTSLNYNYFKSIDIINKINKLAGEKLK